MILKTGNYMKLQRDKLIAATVGFVSLLLVALFPTLFKTIEGQLLKL